MAEKTVIMDAQAISRAITRISFEIVERNRGAEDLCLIGIRSGGAVLARRIADRIGEIGNWTSPCSGTTAARRRAMRIIPAWISPLTGSVWCSSMM